MAGARFVLLGLAQVRSDWFREVSQWATTGAIAAEFVKCVSAEEVRARLAGGRQFSALLVDASLPSLDRDLIDTVQAAGCKRDSRSPRVVRLVSVGQSSF